MLVSLIRSDHGVPLSMADQPAIGRHVGTTVRIRPASALRADRLEECELEESYCGGARSE